MSSSGLARFRFQSRAASFWSNFHFPAGQLYVPHNTFRLVGHVPFVVTV